MSAHTTLRDALEVPDNVAWIAVRSSTARLICDEHASAIAARDVATVELAQTRASTAVLHGDLLDLLAAIGPVLCGDANPPEWDAAVTVFRRVLATHRPEGPTT